MKRSDRFGSRAQPTLLLLSLAVSLIFCLTGCGGQATTASATGSNSGPMPPSNPMPPSPPAAPSPPPAPAGASSTNVQHVVIVVFENHSYEAVVENPDMPYLNSLAGKYSLATNFYANTHPSIGNYFALTTGQVITNDDRYSGTVSADNVVRQLTKSGKTWKSYAEDLPEVGYTGGDSQNYVKRHNPFAYFTDVTDDAQQKHNLVPFSSFSQDLAADNLPNYAFLIPSQVHNAHDCPMSSCQDQDKLGAADNWLWANIDPLFTNPAFMQSGLLIVTWDEGGASDSANGGGHIAVILAGPKVKAGFQSTVFYQHESVLRLSLEALGITEIPKAAANAATMQEFFQ